MKVRITDPKDARIDIRLRREDKRKFYKVCDQYGLCPSVVLERWIHRFVLNSKQIKIMYDGVVLHPKQEVFDDYDTYMDLKSSK